MPSPFLVWNPNATNQENDAAYTADSLRSGGATAGAILPDPTFNKFAFQESIAVKALMDMLTNKGYAPTDGASVPATALSNLIGVLANIMTAADMAVFARLLSPTFTGVPQAPTPAAGDNSTKIATTAFVTALLALGFTFSIGTSGYIKFPTALGGFTLMWTQGASQTGGAAIVQTLNWPSPGFLTACLHVQLTTRIEAQHNDANQWYQIIGVPSKTSVVVFPCNAANSNSAAVFTCFAIGFGY